jgi:hypothetical protein
MRFRDTVDIWEVGWEQDRVECELQYYSVVYANEKLHRIHAYITKVEEKKKKVHVCMTERV